VRLDPVEKGGGGAPAAGGTDLIVGIGKPAEAISVTAQIDHLFTLKAYPNVRKIFSATLRLIRPQKRFVAAHVVPRLSRRSA